MTRLPLLSVLMLVTVFASCDLIDRDETEPAFIHVPAIDFAAGPGEGTSSSNITELWVYSDEKIVGVYDLPADIPVLGSGEKDLMFFAGIKNNGISTTRIRYPFYEPYLSSRSLSPMQRDTIIPVIRYFEDLDIQQKGFESGNFMIPLGGNQGNFETVEDDALVFEGTRSGWGHLDAGETLLLFKDDENLNLPSGVPIFLEMDYSCNNSFAVGLYSNTSGNTAKNMALILNPTTSTPGSPRWNKIYVDLGYITTYEAPNADFFELYFEIVPDDGQAVDLYLDNLKLVRWN